MKTNVKDLHYYLSLPYQIHIVPHIEDGDVLYEAYTPELGRLAVCGDGNTVQEALKSLEESKCFNFEQWLSEGVEIPEPSIEIRIDEANQTQMHA